MPGIPQIHANAYLLQSKVTDKHLYCNILQQNKSKVCIFCRLRLFVLETEGNSRCERSDCPRMYFHVIKTNITGTEDIAMRPSGVHKPLLLSEFD